LKADKIKAITDERGKRYGHPLDHFPTTRGMSEAWLVARYNALGGNGFRLDIAPEQAIRHCVYMICDKLARAANDPTHVDNWDDIAGYAACAKMVLEGKQNNKKGTV
jgi:hypothetical protein